MLSVYDARLRAHVPARLPAGTLVERDGPLTRTIPARGRGWIEYRDLGELSVEELDALIARQVARFAELGRRGEWKLHTHDRPAFLAERLEAAGFVPEELETVVVAEIALLPRSEPPRGVTLREVHERADLDRIAAMEKAVWGDDHRWLAEMLEDERAADPDALAILVAEAGEEVVSAGWIRFPSGTEFGTLWGGSTLPEWRGRGIYRSLVSRRAELAAARGCRWLQVDASDDSRPILERLGFVAVTQTRPYVWSPP